jgi:hypothetical protein
MKYFSIKLDKIRKISIVAAILVSLAFLMNYYLIVLPNRSQKELLAKQVESVAPKDEIISEENVPEEVSKEENAESSSLIDFESFNKKVDEKKDYVADPSDKTADYQSSDLNKTSKKTDKEFQQEVANTKLEADKKVQGSLVAKLEADKALYDAKMKNLYLDCEHQFDSIESNERNEILKTESMLTAANADPKDEQSQQYIDRVKDKYKSEYTYLANTCEVNMQMIEATKYW